ncbi:hypothetical protein RYA99_12555 [Pseudomonas syringae pv. actinidifoliorum]|uniref:hypothetical protein n=1 Tax=Pseudomonas syringae TaxID=317 RepID=UPI001F1C154C|nr:hypothetical protein [Pseudomonas syringae]MDU8429220.1 hypothetical protein [Pseudomonas syringae pv. actinidifoliorum]MBL3827582.1 hypothetical protein [Pseudomonas syringae pv. theae]MBL3836849.1 hypothetical protein [Pseudomonas syringae pv. theae]MBL3866827.1 hypothetical protein [Pseudomonas syringae pv. theae]MDU8520017.1 hypothetical protein [Pseudomonas syringae pv. actinidifoliorum]
MAGQYSGTQTTKTFSYLYSGARRALDIAESDEKGSFYQVMNCLILQAFTVEAYLNHLIDGNEDHGMTLSLRQNQPTVWDKYKAIAKALGLSPVKLIDAYPHVAAVLEFRNSLAHGKTESISVNEILDSNEAPHRASDSQFPGWMRFCVVDNAKVGLKSVERLIEELHSRAGLGNYPFSSLGSGSFSFTPLH